MADIEMVDDYFWLKFAKDHISDAITTRDNAAKSLDTYLKFVWPIYTGFFALSTALSIIPGSMFTKLIMGLPVIIVPIASFYCVKVQLPIFEHFHANEPDSIVKDLYTKIIKQKNKDLHTAKAWVLISALSIGVAIFIFRLGDLAPNYSVKISAQPSGKALRIQGKLPKGESFALLATGYDSSGNASHFIEVPKISADDDGLIDTVISNNGITKDPAVFCSWKSGVAKTKIISSK